MITEELKKALEVLPHVKVVFLEENGDWHFNEPSKTPTIKTSREEILGEKKPSKKAPEKPE